MSGLRGAVRRQAGLFLSVFCFSAVVNLLMLTGPLFMLQVYDRVLGSRSQETLVALLLVVGFLFLMMALLDIVRTRVMTRAAARIQADLAPGVFDAAFRRSVLYPADPAAAAAQRDLDSVRMFVASPVLMALFDLPFVPVFLVGLFIFHPWIGWFAVAGGAILLGILGLNQMVARSPVLAAQSAGMRADRLADHLRETAELVQGLGMKGAGSGRWNLARAEAQDKALSAGDIAGVFGSVTRTFRLFLQSALLALGAWLVLRGELTAGAMIASSILLGRALAPIEQAVSGWAVVQRAQEGWRRLGGLLAAVPPAAPRLSLPRPRSLLEVSQLSVTPPGARLATLKGLSFGLEPGRALGVIGPSGAGKSTLGMALTGLWPVSAGTIRLDGATLDQYDPDILGRHLGYLPQRVALFDGTIAENIARLALAPDAGKVVEAAKRAAAHETILALPEGYDTRISHIGGRLSGGQIQRIGLARALYGDPVLLILDEPNANLDNDGSAALNAAVRAAKEDGRSVIIMAHRPAAIQECDYLMVLDKGLRAGFGPRDEVLKALVRNATEIVRPAGAGGVT